MSRADGRAGVRRQKQARLRRPVARRPWTPKASTANMPRGLAVLVLAGAAPLASPQDMRGDCVSCADLRRKCDLECVAPPDVPVKDPETGRPALGRDVDACLAACAADEARCDDSPEAVACLACVEACAYPFDEAMLACLQTMDATARTLDGPPLDGCSVAAARIFDDCADACHGEDNLGGWTPEAEAGAPSKGPFDRKRYARNFAEATARGEFLAPERRDAADRHGPGLKNDDDEVSGGSGNPHGGAGGEARGDGGAGGEARGDGGAGGGKGDRDAGAGGSSNATAPSSRLDATQTSSVVIPETTDERVFFLALGLSGVAMMLAGIVFMTHSWYLTHSSAAILARARPK